MRKIKYVGALYWIIILLLSLNCISCKSKVNGVDAGKEKNETLYPLHFFHIAERDPFVLTDPVTQSYYIHSNAGNSVAVYQSKDLSMWRKLEDYSFIPEPSFWGKKDFWAPDLFHYKGDYYLFITVSSETAKRGTTILISDSPRGPFKPLTNSAITPADWMCLDASLFVDHKNQPWLIFCHEWLEATDGGIYAVALSEDLTSVKREPVLLFTASSAPWVGSITAHHVTGYVTDAPYIHRLDDGTLIMLWSSFDKQGMYAIGQAYSTSGEITGPWLHEPMPLNSDDGGHAMLFKDLNGKLKIAYHAPNSKNWRVSIKGVTLQGKKLIPGN